MDHLDLVAGIEFINSDCIATGSYDQMVKIWLISTGLTQRTIRTVSGVVSLKLLSNGINLACGLRNGNIEIYNINTGSLFTTLNGHASNVRDLVLLSGVENLLASSSQDTSVRIWDLTTNTNKFTMNGHTGIVYGLKQISSDTLSSGSWGTTVKLWNITNGALIRTLTGHSSYIFLVFGCFK